MQTHCIRLHRGDDINIELKRYVRENHIVAAVIVSCVGCVSKASIRDAGGVKIHSMEEPLEIVSITGTLSKYRTHIHISFSRENLSTIGGHLVNGCIVNTTAEIVLLECDNVVFQKTWDETTGYHELEIQSLE